MVRNAGLLGLDTMCCKAENICLENTLVTYLHNGFAVSHSRSQSQTMCLKTRQLVSDATLKRTMQASMCLLIAGVLQVCTYQAWRRSIDQGWRRHPHGWYCATWHVALICGSWYVQCIIQNRNSLQTMQLRMQVTSAVITQICLDYWHHLHTYDYLLSTCK